MVKVLNKRGNITYLELSNDSGLKVILSTFGAGIVEIWFNDVLMSMSPLDVKGLEREDVYYGQIVGPICNRIENGLLKINDKEYQFPLNEEKGVVHSGKDGLSNRNFDYLIEDESIVFTLAYQGVLPGKTIYKVKYSLDGTSLKLELNATPSEDNIIVLTNHSFFTLGEDCVDKLSLTVSSDYFVQTDSALIPRNKKPIDDYLDFNKEKKLTGTYDHCYFVDSSVKCVLKSTNYKLEVESDYSCLQIYTDNFFDGVKVKNTSLMTRRAIAIEPEDSLLDRKQIKSGDIYHRFITYRFSKL